MKITAILLSTLCLLSLCIPGNVPLEAQQTTSIQIDVTNSSTLLQSWRPYADTSLTFEIKVTVPTDFSSGTLTAYLQNETNYIGTSGNSVSTTQGLTDPDLQIRKTDGWIQNESTFTHSLGANTNTISLCVDCFDYAAYGELVLTASGSGFTSNTVTVQIPTDANGNKIADSWQNDATVRKGLGYDPDADVDRGINDNLGDKITVINEYRGLNVNGSWTDTDPNGWDVFIRSDFGIGPASYLPMTVHEMSKEEVSYYDAKVYAYCVTGKCPPEGARTSQEDEKKSFYIGGDPPFALRLTSDPTIIAEDGFSTGSDVLGEMGHLSTGTIYPSRIEKMAGYFNVSYEDLKNAVLAHEIGHGVGLKHCPDTYSPNCYMWGVKDDVSTHVSQWASHHDQEYNLTGSSRGNPLYYFPDRTYIPSIGIRVRQPVDVNGDGVVNILDLTLVASNINTGFYTDTADVNYDGLVDASDLAEVAAAIGSTPCSYTELPEDVNGDGVVNILDLTSVTSNMGETGTNAADVNCDNVVNINDLILVAQAHGNTVTSSEE